MIQRLVLAAIVLSTACDAGTPRADPRPSAPGDTGRPELPERPAARTATLTIEGMAEPIELRLFRAPEDFALPFTAYVPADLSPEVEDPSSIRFVAEFGGQRNTDAFIHTFVFPPGTDRERAVNSAIAYKTGRGIPVGQGLDPLERESTPPHPEWALESFRFRYQSGGTWYAGVIGIGTHGDRYFQIVRHWPVEYGDGFPPRADLITETWIWEDGTGLITQR